MMLTDFHSAYFAHELTKRCPSDSIEKLAGALVDAQVDLNPHQVEAALFAFRSPLSRGAMLADEVGLGKTIEAGLVLSQKWAERKRKLLVITPANLRKQWHQELSEKFFLPCRILEAKSYNDAIRRGSFQPFQPSPDAVVICSYQFARAKASDVANTLWDLVVIDEAHRLRNVYKPSNVIANILKHALARSPKLLLTATPLQNSLLELFGLVSFIDDHAFGDLKSFREQFANLGEDEVFRTLKARLAPICHRTLRRQVLEYVPFTKRHALVEEFTPAESEDRLYTEVSAYLQRDNLQALPSSQRSLMTLVLRKLLASSTFAIAGALDTLIARLKLKVGKKPEAKPLEEELDEDYEALDETAEEWGDDPADAEPLSEKDRTALEQEIRDLEAFRDLALTITQNAKGRALLTALDKAFAEAARLGAAKKAIIFTESRKTQDYLLRLLQDSPYSDGIVLFNGSNTDDRSKAIYTEWLRRNTGTDKVTGSRTADMRSALVDYFRDRGSIMIATEAGAEGINLQFCSLVVNYDLPWNPQRIEQRIGRCHRYGQKHDVVVVNFLNRNNEADQRVFELLDQKFKLFEGVFGASDEVLGAIESGVDFEKRIARIYQDCRTPGEIRASFARLQDELTAQINEAITNTRRQLLENFDEEVHEKLKVSKTESEGFQNRYEKMLMRLADGFVKEPAVVTRKDFNPAGMSADDIERMKLEDGVRLHAQVAVELETYARQTGQPIVKPFVLVIARDTTHATQLLELIRDDKFFEGRYKDRVIQVDSSKTGKDEDEMIERLLKVESPEEPTEIVIHVNMLKEGWDVTNLYTIVPLRAANARILIEQSIGRGLRLPYGKRTGVNTVDRLNIIAHDKFQEIVDEAMRPDSPIRLQQLVLDPTQITQKLVTVLSTSIVVENLGLAEPTSTPGPTSPTVPVPKPIFATEAERKVAQVAYDVIRSFEGKTDVAPTVASLQNREFQARVVAEVKRRLGPQQLEIFAEGDAVATVVAKTTEQVVLGTIDIPRIIVVPKDEVKSGFKPFKLDLAAFRYPVPSDELVAQTLRTGEQESISLGRGGIEEQRLEDYVVGGLVDFDDVSYDDHAELLYDLAAQTVKHFKSYLKDEVEVRKVLRVHQKPIAAFIHAQMLAHFWEASAGYDVKVSKGFTELRASAYTASAKDAVLDCRHPPADKSRIAQYLYSGFKRCLYRLTKFQSDTERKLAIVLDRDAKRWFRPAKGQFQIFYKVGHDHQEYQPDFVAETEGTVLMIETKRASEMDDSVVQAKRDAGVEWCKHASAYLQRNGGKPWRYLLIPHDVIAENMTLDGLENTYALPV